MEELKKYCLKKLYAPQFQNWSSQGEQREELEYICGRPTNTTTLTDGHVYMFTKSH